MQGWISLLSVVVAALSLGVVLLKGLTSSAREDGKTAEILRGVNEKLEDITNQIRETGKSVGEIDRRLVKVEESTKSAHHRIDGLETKMNQEKTA